MPEPSLTQMQAQRNADAASNWDNARSHRDHVTRLLLEKAEEATASTGVAAPRLCVLGAGNANDLDLKRLSERYAEITLVDIDGAALERGLAQQDCSDGPGFRLVGGRDLTGVWPQLAEMRERRSQTGSADADSIARLSRAIPEWEGAPELGRFEVVASTCLLSQLVEVALMAIGENLKGVEAAVALRHRHFRLMGELLSDGGWGVLVTDFVSSVTNRQLCETPPHLLPGVLNQMLRQGNCFTALHPVKVHGTLVEDPWLAKHVKSPGCLEPWLWNFGARHYAVTAVPFQRLPAKSGDLDHATG